MTDFVAGFKTVVKLYNVLMTGVVLTLGTRGRLCLRIFGGSV